MQFHAMLCAERSKAVEYYDFLQVNTDSSKSEVIDQAKKSEQNSNEEVEQMQIAAAEHDPPFIDFLSVGSTDHPS